MQLKIDKRYLIRVKDYMEIRITKTPLILLSTGEDYVFRNSLDKPKKKVVLK